ncbi:MAG: YicC/YloC family endoribonuclease [Candidatus Omnitrophota bacterium]|nr:YicC/YloC family endoribonuclease [Candidatus Omnitrophota bacterium]
MTGYGRAIRRLAAGTVTVELRSTNHRYLEVEHRLPQGLSALQGRFTQLIREEIHRGRVEANVTFQATRQEPKVTFDEEMLARYYSALLELKGRFGLKGPVTLDHLLALPHAVTIAEDRVPVEELWDAIRHAAQVAMRELVQMRRREGGRLTADLRRQIGAIERHLRDVKQRLPKALEQQRHHLRERLRELLGAGTVSVSMLEQAAALVKEVDIHEELVRLDSHLTHMRQALTAGRPLGKQLDFIAQELMREVNTMGAKANDPDAGRHVVAMKGCIEKIREQVQNLE